MYLTRKIKKKWYKLLRVTPLISKKHFYKAFYKFHTGRTLDLENPKLLNEKLTWLKMYLHDPLLTSMADKFKAREFVKSRIGEEYLNELFGVYKSPQEIEWDKLPNQFIAKANHSCGRNKIVTDKALVDRKQFNRYFNKYLKENYYARRGLEWVYKDIEPRLVIENLLSQPGYSDLIDYKFYCFSGKPEFIQVNQHIDGIYFKDFMTLDWKPTVFKHTHRERTDRLPHRPENLDKMIELASSLTQGFPFVRCDLYNIEGKIIFGEFTFYPSDASRHFEPEKYNRIFGDKIILPTIPEGKDEITNLGISY